MEMEFSEDISWISSSPSEMGTSLSPTLLELCWRFGRELCAVELQRTISIVKC
jgi:hypothetical protein